MNGLEQTNCWTLSLVLPTREAKRNRDAMCYGARPSESCRGKEELTSAPEYSSCAICQVFETVEAIFFVVSHSQLETRNIRNALEGV
jgi:hypothetical protein